MLFIAFFASFLSLAHATAGSSGVVMPGATPLPKGEGSAGLFAAGIHTSNWPTTFFGLTGSLGLRNDWSVQGLIAPEFISGTWDSNRFVLATAFRKNVHASSHLNVAPYLSMYAEVIDFPDVFVAPGLALEGGWEHIRLDLSGAPLALWLGAPLHGGPPFFPVIIPAVEGGITGRIGAHHAVRLGGVLPTVTYRFTSDRFYLEGSYVNPLNDLWAWWVETGLRF